MKWQPEQPYNNLPQLPPRADLDSTAILKACIPARVALAELKKAGVFFPNQGFRALSDRPLCSNTAIEICSTIKGIEREIGKIGSFICLRLWNAQLNGLPIKSVQCGHLLTIQPTLHEKNHQKYIAMNYFKLFLSNLIVE